MTGGLETARLFYYLSSLRLEIFGAQRRHYNAFMFAATCAGNAEF
jgi:hypothetical protein